MHSEGAEPCGDQSSRKSSWSLRDREGSVELIARAPTSFGHNGTQTKHDCRGMKSRPARVMPFGKRRGGRPPAASMYQGSQC